MNQNRMGRTQAAFAAAFVFAAALPLCAITAGCGKGANSVQTNQIAGITEDALVNVLLGTPPEAVRQAPPDKPLLTPNGYNRVLIAADERGFVSVSKGSFGAGDVRTVQERVVKGVDKRIGKKNNFHAESTTFPPPAPPPATGEPNRVLIATLTPVVQVAGSPDDVAKNRTKNLLLVRLTVSDAQTGVAIVVRDYYSGRDVSR